MMSSHKDARPLRGKQAGRTLGMLAFWFCGFVQAAPPEARLPDKHRAFLTKHCLSCHDSETQEGKVNLEDLSFRITTLKQAELWQKVLNALNAGEMPPEKKKQPDKAAKADFLDDLAQTMVAARRSLSDTGGRITMMPSKASSPARLSPRTIPIGPI